MKSLARQSFNVRSILAVLTFAVVLGCGFISSQPIEAQNNGGNGKHPVPSATPKPKAKPTPAPSPSPRPKASPTPSTIGFRIIIDTNQINAVEAAQTIAQPGLLFADGSWNIPQNSIPIWAGGPIDWASLFKAIGPIVISEDNPFAFRSVDTISSIIGRLPYAELAYVEGANTTTLTSAQFTTCAAHVVPGYGPVGARLIALGRTYYPGDSRTAEINVAATDPNVAGIAFEFVPENYNLLNIAAGVRHVRSLGKPCYLLVPPIDQAVSIETYVASIEALAFSLNRDGLATDANVYIVLACYLRSTTSTHFIASFPGDPTAISTAAAFLEQYRSTLQGKPAGSGSSGGN